MSEICERGEPIFADLFKGPLVSCLFGPEGERQWAVIPAKIGALVRGGEGPSPTFAIPAGRATFRGFRKY